MKKKRLGVCLVSLTGMQEKKALISPYHGGALLHYDSFAKLSDINQSGQWAVYRTPTVAIISLTML